MTVSCNCGIHSPLRARQSKVQTPWGWRSGWPHQEITRPAAALAKVKGDRMGADEGLAVSPWSSSVQWDLNHPSQGSVGWQEQIWVAGGVTHSDLFGLACLLFWLCLGWVIWNIQKLPDHTPCLSPAPLNFTTPMGPAWCPGDFICNPEMHRVSLPWGKSSTNWERVMADIFCPFLPTKKWCWDSLHGSSGSHLAVAKGFPGGSDCKESICSAGIQVTTHGKISWRREWLPTPVFLPEEFHEQRSLVGYSPWDRKELDTTECLTHTHTHRHTHTHTPPTMHTSGALPPSNSPRPATHISLGSFCTFGSGYTGPLH